MAFRQERSLDDEATDIHLIAASHRSWNFPEVIGSVGFIRHIQGKFPFGGIRWGGVLKPENLLPQIAQLATGHRWIETENHLGRQVPVAWLKKGIISLHNGGGNLHGARLWSRLTVGSPDGTLALYGAQALSAKKAPMKKNRTFIATSK